MKKSNHYFFVTLFLLILLTGLVNSLTFPSFFKNFNNKLNDLSTTWVNIYPVQCNLNPWQQANPFSSFERFQNVKTDEKSQIKQYLQTKSINPITINIKKKYDIVCMSCSCPRGDEVDVLIYKKDLNKITGLGFNVMNQ